MSDPDRSRPIDQPNNHYRTKLAHCQLIHRESLPQPEPLPCRRTSTDSWSRYALTGPSLRHPPQNHTSFATDKSQTSDVSDEICSGWLGSKLYSPTLYRRLLTHRVSFIEVFGSFPVFAETRPFFCPILPIPDLEKEWSDWWWEPIHIIDLYWSPFC